MVWFTVLYDDLCSSLEKQTVGKQERKHRKPLGGSHSNPVGDDFLWLVGVPCGIQIEPLLTIWKLHSSHQHCLRGRKEASTARNFTQPISLHHPLFLKKVYGLNTLNGLNDRSGLNFSCHLSTLHASCRKRENWDFGIICSWCAEGHGVKLAQKLLCFSELSRKLVKAGRCGTFEIGFY